MKTNLLTAPPAPDVSNCFRLFLQAELGRRCARNSQYSLRSFAKFLAKFSRSAVHHLSQQVRQLMLGAMRNVPAGRFEYSSTTLAVSTSRLPAVLEQITRFRRDLVALLGHDNPPDDVYQLEVNFFPITRLQHEREIPDGTTGDAVADLGEESCQG